MKQMTSKERVLNAINHKEVDRIPIDLGGTACSMVDTEYFAVKKYLNLDYDIKPYRKGSNVCYYDEKLLEKLEIDVRRVFARQNGKYPIYGDDGIMTNEWGLVQRDSGLYIETIKNPLAEADIDDLDFYDWPKANEILDIENLREDAKKLYEENKYAISLRMPCNGIFEIACWLRGMENFMIDTLTNPEFVYKLIEKITNVQIELYGYLLNEVGEYVDIVESGDDYGSQESTLMSPNTYRQFIFPYRKKLNDFIKSKAPQSKIFLHSCGAIESIIEDLISTGIDILNPIQTSARGMDIVTLKQKYGDRICFHGGVDTQKALKGTYEDVDNEVEKLISVLGQGGGYILGSCNHLQSDIPPTNVIRMFSSAIKNVKRKETI